MINNLIDILTYENIYLIANWGVIPFWLLLIIAPNHFVTSFFVRSNKIKSRYKTNDSSVRKGCQAKNIIAKSKFGVR